MKYRYRLFLLCTGFLSLFWANPAWSNAPEVVSLPEVVVTGSRIAGSMDEIASPTYVISSADIVATGARTVADVLISRVPGVSQSNRMGWAQDAEVSVRGLTTQMLVLVDGIPFYRPTHVAGGASIDLHSIPVESIERIEVVKGAGSAMYGSLAAAGVINIITRKGDERGGSLTVEAGPDGLRRYAATAAASNDIFRVQAYAERTEEGRRRIYKTTDEGGKLYYSDGYEGDAGGVTISRGPWSFKAEAGRYTNTFEDASSPTYTPPYTAVVNTEEKTYSRYALSYAGERIHALLGYDIQKREYEHIPGCSYDDRSLTADIYTPFRIGSARAVGGVFYRREWTTFREELAESEKDHSRSNIAPYLEVSLPAGDVVVNAGLRYEFWDQEDAENHRELMPKLSLEYQSPGGQTWYLSAGRFFAMPSFYELYTTNTMWLVKGNPDLKPEKGWSYDAGVRGKDSRGSWQIGAFAMFMDDKIVYVTDPATFEGTYDNVAEFRSYGIEAERTWTLGGPYSARLSGTWMRAEERDSAGDDWRRSLRTPEWTVQGALRYDRRPWSAELALRYIDDRPFNAGGGADGSSFLTDLSLEWNSPVTKSGASQRIRLSCLNVFDEAYDYTSLNRVYLAPERSFVLTWSMTF